MYYKKCIYDAPEITIYIQKYKKTKIEVHLIIILNFYLKMFVDNHELLNLDSFLKTEFKFSTKKYVIKDFFKFFKFPFKKFEENEESFYFKIGELLINDMEVSFEMQMLSNKHLYFILENLIKEKRLLMLMVLDFLNNNN